MANPHALHLGQLSITPDPEGPTGLRDELEYPVSKLLTLLLSEDESELKSRSICSLINIFKMEFPGEGAKAFAFQWIIGYLETGRLNTLTKIAACFGLLVHGSVELQVQDQQARTAISAIVYMSLKYGATGPLRMEDKYVFSDSEFYVISRISLSTLNSRVGMEGLGAIVRRWEDEIESMVNSNASIRNVVARDVVTSLSSIENSLVQSTLSQVPYELSADVRGEMVTRLAALATARKIMRERLECAYQEAHVNAIMGEVLPGWKKCDNIIRNPATAGLQELLETLPPPEITATSDTLQWLLPKDTPEADIQEFYRSQTLIVQATKAPLAVAQRNELTAQIKGCSRMSEFREFQPDLLPLIIEQNPTVAFDILLKANSSEGNINEYLEVLATSSADISVNSMDVINQLLGINVNIPPEFLTKYLANCMRRCESLNGDKYVQNRSVRMICVFLHALIRGKVIAVQDIYVEVIPFLLTYIRIKEAAAAFRLIRTLESEDAELQEVIARTLEDNEELREAASQLVAKEKETKSLN